MKQRIAYLTMLYNSTFLPIQYFVDDTCLLCLPQVESDWNPSELPRHNLLHEEVQVSYLTTDAFLHYGIVRNFDTKEVLIIGPITSTRIQHSALPQIMSSLSISLLYKHEIEDFFQRIPTFSYQQFINFLALFHREFNGKIIDPGTYFLNLNSDHLVPIEKKHSSALYDAKEEERFHNTYAYEQELFHYVEAGNIMAIENLFTKTTRFEYGEIGSTSLRQQQNLFIASVTMLTRHSIAGGLDIETAYQLSDTYIQESESATSIEKIEQLSYLAVLDFAKRVAACKIPTGMSPDIYKCIQYVSTHTNQSLSVADIANAVGKSRSYISRRFKQELGFNLSDFIMRRKLEEGKSLLTYSDKSISEISEYLCFSSQSYFQNVFKKKYGLTPYEYRISTR